MCRARTSHLARHIYLRLSPQAPNSPQPMELSTSGRISLRLYFKTPMGDAASIPARKKSCATFG